MEVVCRGIVIYMVINSVFWVKCNDWGELIDLSFDMQDEVVGNKEVLIYLEIGCQLDEDLVGVILDFLCEILWELNVVVDDFSEMQ